MSREWGRESIILSLAALAIGFVAAMTGCSTTPAPGPVSAQCLPLGNVTADQQAAAANALAAAAPDQQAALLPVFNDWVAMRDADRACIAASMPPKGATP